MPHSSQSNQGKKRDHCSWWTLSQKLHNGIVKKLQHILFFHKLFSCNIPAAGKIQFLGFVYVYTHAHAFCLDHLFPVALMNFLFHVSSSFLNQQEEVQNEVIQVSFLWRFSPIPSKILQEKVPKWLLFPLKKTPTLKLPACRVSLQSLCNVNLPLGTFLFAVLAQSCQECIAHNHLI